MEGGSSDMTLAFELRALKALSNPAAVFSDAREWSRYVGVVSEEPTYAVTNYTRKHRIRQDFFSGPRGVPDSLESVKSQFDTERYVLIGTESSDETIAEETGWEYLAIEDAASAASWQLEADDAGVITDDEDVREDWP